MPALGRIVIAFCLGAALLFGGYWAGAQQGMRVAETPVIFAEDCAPSI